MNANDRTTRTPLRDRIFRNTAPWTKPAPDHDPVAVLATQHLFDFLRVFPQSIIPLAYSGNVVEVRDADTGRTMRLTITAEEVA